MSERKEQIFLSYAREDVETAERIHNDLKKWGLNSWFDREALRGGDRWKNAIKKAIRQSSHFIALLSSKSVTKRGYVQKELREALEVLDEVPESDIFIIPVRLDESEPSQDTLHELHWIDLFPSYEEGFKNILRAIRPDLAEWKVAELPLVDSEDYFPTSALVEIEISPSGISEETVRVVAFLDTGADVSCIPRNILSSFKTPPASGVTIVEDFLGHNFRIRKYKLDFRLGDLVFDGIEAVVINSDHVLIGRDILGGGILQIDWPNRKVILRIKN